MFLYDALQHIENGENVLNESIRISRPNSVICVIETNDNGIRYYKETENLDIDKVDPRDFSLTYPVSTEILEGKYSSAYILKKE